MLTRNGKNLRIFEDFVIDRSLPKYNVKQNGDGQEDDMEMNEVSMDSNGSFTFGTGEIPTLERLTQDLIASLQLRVHISPTIKNRLCLWVAKLMFRRLKDKEVKPNIDVEQFFNNIKTQFSYINGSKEVEKYYLNSIEQAKKLGQTALLEKLTSQRNVVLNECKLKENKINKFVTEDQVVEFYKSVGKPDTLKLSWIKNFTRIIPSKAVELKEKADQLNVFDNYVVLHYDPENESEEDTNKEKEEKKKDPILFGVMENSRRLYFIADWVDDYCDLTLDKMMEELGDEVNTVNNQNIKSYIDK